jgi:Vitamin K-dependent gamma-carboxylase
MTVVGLRPWFPGPRAWSEWWTTPVRAERLAAMRIGFGLVLLVDVLGTYAPFLRDYYGPGSLSWPDVFAGRFESPYWYWSVLRWLPDAWGPGAAVAAWALSAAALVVGWYPRVAAAVAWALSLSFLNSNYYLHNGGDRLRHFIPFLLMLCPCGAAWALTPPRAARAADGPVHVYRWPLGVVLALMVPMYFFNGIYKAIGPGWRDGSILYYVFTDAGWSRWSIVLPPGVLLALAWVVLVWEVGFPVWLMTPGTRVAALWLGVTFHVGTALHLELGLFGLYALCLYLPLVPWERWPAHFPLRPAARAGALDTSQVHSV